MRFIKNLVASCAIVLLVAVTACAPTNFTIPYDRAATRVQTIGLVTPFIKPEGQALLANGAGQSFGLLGALVEAGVQSNRDSRFNAVLRQQQFSAINELNDRLRAALEAKGYQVVIIPVPRSGTDFLRTYPASPAPVDAYLDVTVNIYGYLSIGRSAPYRPAFFGQMQLVDARNNAVLMREGINMRGGVDVQPDPEFNYDDSDVMMASGPRTVQGLRDMFARVTQGMAGVLQ